MPAGCVPTSTEPHVDPVSLWTKLRKTLRKLIHEEQSNLVMIVTGPSSMSFSQLWTETRLFNAPRTSSAAAAATTRPSSSRPPRPPSPPPSPSSTCAASADTSGWSEVKEGYWAGSMNSTPFIIMNLWQLRAVLKRWRRSHVSVQISLSRWASLKQSSEVISFIYLVDTAYFSLLSVCQ